MAKSSALFVCLFALFTVTFVSGCGELGPLSPINLANNENGKQDDSKNQANGLMNELSTNYSIKLDDYFFFSEDYDWSSHSAIDRTTIRTDLTQFLAVVSDIIERISDHKVFEDGFEKSDWQRRQTNAQNYLNSLNKYDR